MLSASTGLPHRVLGARRAPARRGVVRSGTWAQSPALQAPSSTRSPSTTWRVGRQVTCPRGPRGRSVRSSIGYGFTPAVQTRVSAWKRAPSERHDLAVHAGLQSGVQAQVDAALRELAGRVRAHLRADLGQDPVGRLDQYEPDLAGSSSGSTGRDGPCPPISASLDAGVPPPTKTNVSGLAVVLGPGDRRTSSRSRMVAQEMASPMVLKPTASRRPGIGGSRPLPGTMTGRTSSWRPEGWTSDLAACSIRVTSPGRRQLEFPAQRDDVPRMLPAAPRAGTAGTSCAAEGRRRPGASR